MNKEGSDSTQIDRELRESEDRKERIGSTHGLDTVPEEETGYAREIGAQPVEPNRGHVDRTRGSGLSEVKKHPAKSLELRRGGFGIGGGYERPYVRRDRGRADSRKGLYGPIPHSGYYGGDPANQRFKTGQAGFREEEDWLKKQWVEETSGFEKKKK